MAESLSPSISIERGCALDGINEVFGPQNPVESCADKANDGERICRDGSSGCELSDDHQLTV
jgi:hypothetical protein